MTTLAPSVQLYGVILREYLAYDHPVPVSLEHICRTVTNLDLPTLVDFIENNPEKLKLVDLVIGHVVIAAVEPTKDAMFELVRMFVADIKERGER